MVGEETYQKAVCSVDCVGDSLSGDVSAASDGMAMTMNGSGFDNVPPVDETL